VLFKSHSLSCFCNGKTILSEGDGRGDQEGHLVRDGRFFEDSWGQRFQRDERSVLHVCGYCGLEAGVCQYYLHDITLLTTLSNSFVEGVTDKSTGHLFALLGGFQGNRAPQTCALLTGHFFFLEGKIYFCKNCTSFWNYCRRARRELNQS
jgi:hypothetical protein